MQYTQYQHEIQNLCYLLGIELPKDEDIKDAFECGMDKYCVVHSLADGFLDDLDHQEIDEPVQAPRTERFR